MLLDEFDIRRGVQQDFSYLIFNLFIKDVYIYI